MKKENNKKNSNLFLFDKNKSKTKYRLKSSKNSYRTINNESSKKRYDSNIDNNQELPNFGTSLKKYVNNNEISEDELDDIYIPKYPRPAILTGRNGEIKSPSYSMNYGLPEKNENDFNNINFCELGLLNKRKFQTIIPKKSAI